ncbi:MAG: bifunctional diguanylate cyclase/phosphodiesterase, partial [Eubacteriales bacterium]|nr:bifunctional diguanylate cyclase/phosphodiesterase [Eubacteriales bacterium]
LFTLANVDHLTGLPNRRWFIESLDDIIETAFREDKNFYIVFIDMDSFKKINDTLGHDKGDIFLQSIATRLKENARENDLLGRIGGDEFGLVINRDVSKKEVYREIEKIKDGLQVPVEIDSSQIKLSASFGVAEYPKDGTTSTELLRHSDLSMYKAKSLGKNRIRFFSKALMEDLIYQMKMEDRLKKASANNELHLDFQPQYELKTGKLRGFEALLRWKSKEFGSVAPTEFIELAEHKGLIISLGEWVIQEAFRSHFRFKRVHDGELVMSINLSLAQITDSNFLKLVKNCLKEYDALPDEIELEVTESIFAEAIEQTAQVLRELKKLGIRIALDDFGTGYSSISYLKLFPIDTLKIDRSFTRDLANDINNRNIILDLIALGHDLNAAVLVEGIEQEYQIEYLKAAECDYGQGFLLGKPMGGELVLDLLKSFETEI